ncbi:hypothetical protein LTR07_001482 [Exophiala xenobiotica]|nr:hypothetical protein LTR79_005812 [Exophiala xenobiotica]KAK5471546.1 hypothetical protein LTR26_010853 [Exophiala xenobiotica]KAK5514582.1 hypothetical protein LTR21_004828 [Exophiala xenobiotica]KAK5525789.1 hypothetical protein LTR07_001482 [Exophiala xenobiotica]
MATPAGMPLDEYQPPNWNPLLPPHTIRVIDLACGAGDDPLSCTLLNIALEQVAGIYIALSYAWGGQDLTETIVCNGFAVRITKNLHSALRRLRQPQRVIAIWCDALCIKQGNDPASLLERSQQIPLMDRIFSSALLVVIDLGDDDGSLDQAVEGINAIVRTPLERRARCHLEAEPQRFLELPEFTHPMWLALDNLMSRPWFQRIWCVQEAVLARDIRVTFGRYCLTFEALVCAACVYLVVSHVAARTYQNRWSRSRSATAVECLIATNEKRRARISHPDNYRVSLCDLIRSTMSQHSTDIRDRVYALYGMAGRQIAADLPVSYSESVDELSRRVSDYLLRNGNGTWMLVHAGGSTQGRPSWTIDLSNLSTRYDADPLLSTVQAAGESTAYEAGGKSLVHMQVGANDDYIKVRGVVATKVVSMARVLDVRAGRTPGQPGNVDIPPQYIMSCIMWFYSVLVRTERASPQAPDALWRTLVVDFNPHNDDSHRKPNGRVLPGFQAYFDDLLTYIKRVVNADPPIDINTLTTTGFEQYHVPSSAMKFWIAAVPSLAERRLARTESNGFALVPETSIMNDIIVVFRGVALPFVLRKHGDGYQIVGVSYVHGLMDGEALEQGLEEEDFLLR